MAKKLTFNKKKTITIETGNKIVFIVIGMGRAGSYLAYELSQIVGLSKKTIDVIFADTSVIEEQNLEHEKFIKYDLDLNKASVTSGRCSSSFNLNIEAYDKEITNPEDILKLLEGRMGYFPVIISNDNSAKIKNTVCEAMKKMSDVVYIATDIDDVSGKIVLTYKHEGKFITPDYFTEFPEEIKEIKKPTIKSESKKANIETMKELFLYVDDILCERKISTYVTRFNVETKQIYSKFIEADYGKRKEIPQDISKVVADVGDKVLLIQVGVGGTGAALAYEVAHKASVSKKDVRMIFIDGDIVEFKNLNRQRFIYNDLNKYKSEVTAERCIKAYGKDIEISNDYIESSEDIYNMIRENSGYFPIILGCSDSLKLRQLVCDTIREMPNVSDMPKSAIYIDAGNDEESGQVIFTYLKDGEYVTPDFFTEFPHAIEQLSSAKLVTQMSCDELMNSAPQTKGANLSAASNMYLYLDDILEGREICTYVTHYNISNKQVSSKFIGE